MACRNHAGRAFPEQTKIKRKKTAHPPLRLPRPNPICNRPHPPLITSSRQKARHCEIAPACTPPPALAISYSKSPNTSTRTVCLPFPITNWKPVSAYPAAAMTTYSGCCFPTSALKIPTTIRKSCWQSKTCVTERAPSAGRHKMP